MREKRGKETENVTELLYLSPKKKQSFPKVDVLYSYLIGSCRFRKQKMRVLDIEVSWHRCCIYTCPGVVFYFGVTFFSSVASAIITISFPHCSVFTNYLRAQYNTLLSTMATHPRTLHSQTSNMKKRFNLHLFIHVGEEAAHC